MIRSMTGFAEKSFNSGSLRIKIYMKTLNHRFFDWVFKGPGLGEVENQLRTSCQKKSLEAGWRFWSKLIFSRRIAGNLPLITAC